MPQVKDPGPYDCPCFRCHCKSQLSPAPLTHGLYIGGSHGLFLGLVNFLEQLTEFRETFYLLEYKLIIKGYNLGTARWKKCIWQCM